MINGAMNKLAKPPPCTKCEGRGSIRKPAVPNRQTKWEICPMCGGSGDAPGAKVALK